MRKFILVCTIVLGFAIPALSQTTDCPADKVCISQQTANTLFKAATDLVAAKDAIIKMMAERGTTDAELIKALKLVDEWKEVDVVNGQMILKHEQIEALYEKTITLYQKALDNAFAIIDKLNTQLHGKKSVWSQFLSGLKTTLTILAGIGIGVLIVGEVRRHLTFESSPCIDRRSQCHVASRSDRFYRRRLVPWPEARLLLGTA